MRKGRAHVPQTTVWMEEVVQGHRLHALDQGYTHAKRFKHQNIQYGTVRYGTEGLPGPALLLPDTDARRKKEYYNRHHETICI